MSATDRRIREAAQTQFGRTKAQHRTLTMRELEDWCIFRVRRATRSKVRSVLEVMRADDPFDHFQLIREERNGEEEDA